MNLHHVWRQGLACLHSDTLGGCWEQNVGPLQEKGPLTTESSPQPPVLKGVFFKVKLTTEPSLSNNR